jgi:hypothetical protein
MLYWDRCSPRSARLGSAGAQPAYWAPFNVGRNP